MHAQGSTRRMRSISSGDCINYELYQDSSMNQIWGDNTSNSVNSTSNAAGSVINLSVFGKVPLQTPSSAGDYIDYVVVTLTY